MSSYNICSASNMYHPSNWESWILFIWENLVPVFSLLMIYKKSEYLEDLKVYTHTANPIATFHHFVWPPVYSIFFTASNSSQKIETRVRTNPYLNSISKFDVYTVATDRSLQLMCCVALPKRLTTRNFYW